MAVDDLGRLLVHLVSHLLRDHGSRASRAGVDEADGAPPAWNRATDAEVNDDLAPAGMVPPSANQMPAGLGAEDGLLAEQYYESARGAENSANGIADLGVMASIDHGMAPPRGPA